MKEGGMKNDECWRMNDEGYCFQDVEGFLWLTDERTGICECRVAFATEKSFSARSMCKKFAHIYFMNCLFSDIICLCINFKCDELIPSPLTDLPRDKIIHYIWCRSSLEIPKIRFDSNG